LREHRKETAAVRPVAWSPRSIRRRHRHWTSRRLVAGWAERIERRRGPARNRPEAAVDGIETGNLRRFVTGDRVIARRRGW